MRINNGVKSLHVEIEVALDNIIIVNVYWSTYVVWKILLYFAQALGEVSDTNIRKSMVPILNVSID